MPRCLAVLNALLLTLLMTGMAAAAAGSVLLLDPDPELERAIRSVLEPWDTSVAVQKLGGPGNTMPGSAERARGIATQSNVQAVIWVSHSNEGPALWMYDARADRVVARKLPSGPPFDEGTAASVALMVKTLLRLSDVPPPRERGEPSRRWLSLGLVTGARLNPTEQHAIEPRFGIFAAAWPSAFDERLGAGFELTSGPGVSVDSDLFQGRWTDSNLLIRVHARLDVRPLDFALLAGAGIAVAHLGGTVRNSGRDVSAFRLNPVAAVHGEAGYWLGPAVRLGLRLGIHRPLRTQTYTVYGAPMLHAHSLAAEGALVGEIRLP